MGDLLHALPAVSALRDVHPGWMLGWAVEPQWRALLRADSAAAAVARGPEQPVVDQVHIVPAKQWAKRPLHPETWSSMLRVRREVRHVSYDAALDLQGAVRSAMIARWARPARLLGEAEPREHAARWFFSEPVPSAGMHVIEQAADVVRALAKDTLPLGLPILPIDGAAQQWCEVAGAGVEMEHAVLLHPGAGWGAKRWPVQRYALVGAELARRTGGRVVVNVAPAERELGVAVAVGMAALGVTPLLLTPTVGQLIELTRNVALAIGGDTGPLHLAAALGKPTVGIFGPTDPARNGPFHGTFRVLRDPSSQRDHARRSEPEAGLLRIEPEAVVEAALELLGETGQGSVALDEVAQ